MKAQPIKSLTSLLVHAHLFLTASQLLKHMESKAFEKRSERDAIPTVKNESDVSLEKIVARSTDPSSVTPNGKDGSPTVSKILNSKALEPHTLIFYEFARLRLTTSNLNEDYTQGQLCQVKTNHSAQDLVLEVYLSTFGSREYPSNPNTFELIANGSKIVKLLQVEGHVFWAQQIYLGRIQYPVKHFFAAAIQKTMGETLPGVVTEVSSSENKNSLW